MDRELRDLLIFALDPYLSNKEILAVLEGENIRLSNSHLKRIKARLGLKKARADPAAVVNAIQGELSTSGQLLGYRSMCQRLRVSYSLNVNPQFVRHCLLTLDPEGVLDRRRRRLRRRQYMCEGPLDIIHIDGYDKLKPWGFCIHGAIDGFSRSVLWLQVGRTNNDPSVIASYFLDWVQNEKGTARRIRMDAGTENVGVIDIQKALIYSVDEDLDAAEKSVIVGRSVFNQRIERFWGILRQSVVQYWINLFRDLEQAGLYSKDNCVKCECLLFCFTSLIQCELSQFRTEWNTHTIRGINTGVRPSMMYSFPELNGGASCRVPLENVQFEGLEQYVKRLDPSGTLPEYCDMFRNTMTQRNLPLPTNVDEALGLYGQLLQIYL